MELWLWLGNSGGGVRFQCWVTVVMMVVVGFVLFCFFIFLIWVFGSGRILVGNGGSGGHSGGMVVIGLFDIFFNEFAGFVSRFFFFNLGFWFR